MNTTSFDFTFSKEADYSLSKDQRTDADGRCYQEYFPSASLVEAVQMAIDLQLPLLLEGEPGCGKTQLASAIVYQLTQKNLTKENQLNGNIPKDQWWPYHIWTVKSYTRARDGLYNFDAIRRLRDAQMALILTEEEKVKIKELKTYRTFGPLGRALYDEKTKTSPDKRAVVLIDEVDKADSDFTNDLLLELDEFRFEIPETGEKIQPPLAPPIIILTSNREKPLPDAFLRRCLYFKIEFPEGKKLKEIAQKRLNSLVITKDEALIDRIITKFLEVREDLKQPGSRPPGTSEFLSFVSALGRKLPTANQKTSIKLQKILDDLDNILDKNNNLSSLESPDSLPLLGTILKTEADQKLYANKAKKRKSVRSQ
jgi:MoxR-like ATPase